MELEGEDRIPPEIRTRVKGMSSHDLIANPKTLLAGLEHLREKMVAYETGTSGDSSDTSKKVGGKNKNGKSARSRLAKRTNISESEESEELLSIDSSSDSNIIPIKKSKRGCRTKLETVFESKKNEPEAPETEPDSETFPAAEINAQGKAQFGELCRRFNFDDDIAKSTSRSTRKHDFDLNGDEKGDLLRSVFSNYEEKLKLCNKHTKKVESMTDTEAMEHFDAVKQDLLDIYEGRLHSYRQKLFISDNPDDENTLKGVCVSAPFHNRIYMIIANKVMDFLEPKKRKRDKLMTYFRYVIFPEALIRIYASANDVDITHAEREMKFGAQYDGDLPKSTRRKGKSRVKSKVILQSN